VIRGPSSGLATIQRGGAFQPKSGATLPKDLTADEVRENDIAAMGEGLGTVYSELSNSCAWIHWKWADFIELFGTSPERIELLNQSAGSFFWQLQTSLWNDILLHLARLTDRPRTGRDNLTLQRLPELVVPRLRARVKDLLEDVTRQCAFARDWRNRRLAHDDLALALGDSTARPLTPASRKMVADALAAVVRLMNHVHGHYHDGEVMYEMLVDHSAVALLYVIRDGIEAEAARRTRIEERRYLPEDLVPPRPI